VTGWSWSFGDGSSSTGRSPGHTYATPGVYTVRLTVSADDGTSHTETRAGLVSVAAASDLPPGVARLGCGVNPPASFLVLAGSPRLGTTMTFGVDNPFGTQRPGSIPSLIASWNADPNRPCGTIVAGLGMSAPGTSGERLIAAPTYALRSGAPWQGPGFPAPVVFQLPSNASLLGRTLFVQGRLVDGSAGAPIPLALAGGFALTLQP
jgi:PKD repeat protein